MPAPNPYQYAQAPGQGPYGYYEQQTPAGSFVAANQQQSAAVNPGQAQTAANPYIGQTTQGISGQASVMPYAQQAVQQSQQRNPYVGQTTQQSQSAGTNAYAGSNPYLDRAIDSASSDALRNYNLGTRPQLDSMMRASGSFGNTAIQELQQNAMGDLGRNLGNIASGMRMQDYTQQQGLAENALNRTQQNNQFNSGLSAGDLNRNTAGFLANQQIGLQGYGQALGAAQFDANLGNNVGQFNAGLSSNELGRNAQLQQGLGQFNAGQGNQYQQFAAQMGQQNNQFNAGQGNALGQFNAGQGNAMLAQQRSLNQNADQFNQNMDFNTWQANNTNMRNGQLDQMSMLDRLLGWQGQGVNAATNVQNTPMNYWQQFSGTAGQLGGLGGTNTQNLQGNPYLSGLGGMMTGGQLWNSYFGGGR